MTHLILCREYPPAAYPAGGIGTYAKHMARLLAEAGETVHMIAQRWEGAPERAVMSHDRRLIVHRISLEEPVLAAPGKEAEELKILKLLASSTCPSQVFSWQAAKYAEWLIETEPIDVIEAQEWEAPLYYLQARRAVGLGPKRQPPCMVHLHSPSQMIFDSNEWDETLTDFKPLAHFEELSIRMADALLCPSRYLANGVTKMLRLEPGRIEVIPYPMGVETPALERGPEVWARNAICYVGRLELRKGVIEWVDAAVEVARKDADVSFDFFGSDTAIDGGVGRSVMAMLKQRIPAALRERFRFHGSRSREELMHALVQVAVAVVPSRWENFPFTCIEAMSTGLPVLVSPNGGMAEMIADGESGWICEDGTAAGLADGLRRALATPPEVRAAMGRRAAEDIRRICDDDEIVVRQITLRRTIADAGAYPLKPDDGQRAGLGIVVVTGNDTAECMASIAAQTIATPSVVRGRGEARSGVEALLAAHQNLRSIVCIDEKVRLNFNFAAAVEGAMARNRELAMLAPWILREPHDLDPGPSILSAEMPPYAVVRTEFALSADWLTLGAQGWTGLTYPAPLLTIAGQHPRPKRRYSGMALIHSQSAIFALRWIMAAPLREQLRWLGRILANPRRVVQRVAWRIRGIVAAPRHDAK